MSDPSSAHKPYTTGARPFSAAQKLNVTATSSGWVRVQDADSYQYSGNDNPNTTPEVLVAIRNLAARLTPLVSGFTVAADPTLMSVAAGFTLKVTVHFSQAVKVTGTPQVTMVNGQEGGGSAATKTLNYASGTGSEELLFTLAIAGGGSTILVGDVMGVLANCTALNGGTIKAVSDSENATITNTAQLGLDAGVITATS
tara:strand:- start:66 stop:662 length:597 start_codon:yes stop_codon:yes gene_type:complete